MQVEELIGLALRAPGLDLDAAAISVYCVAATRPQRGSPLDPLFVAAAWGIALDHEAAATDTMQRRRAADTLRSLISDLEQMITALDP